jgi:hypothetical protein
MWAILVAVILAAIAWGKTQSDMAQVKREVGAVRRLERRVERLSTLIEIRFGLKAELGEEEDTRL